MIDMFDVDIGVHMAQQYIFQMERLTKRLDDGRELLSSFGCHFILVPRLVSLVKMVPVSLRFYVSFRCR